jgi:iron(III) transport system permease protein
MLMALVGGIAVILPGASMALSGVIGTLSGGVTSNDNVTLYGAV